MCLSEAERLSDHAVIAMHSERFEVDKIFQAFVKFHPRGLFPASLFINRQVKRDKELSLSHSTLGS